MRDEKCEENKEDVPDVIAALMDEYGAACTVPTSSTRRSTTNSTLATLARSEDSARCGQTVRKPSASVWSTNKWESEPEEESEAENATIQSTFRTFFSTSVVKQGDNMCLDILIGSALSGFGALSIDEVEIELEDLMTPPKVAPKSTPPTQAPRGAWAAVARG